MHSARYRLYDLVSLDCGHVLSCFIWLVTTITQISRLFQTMFYDIRRVHKGH